jgi:hypothetical protein
LRGRRKGAVPRGSAMVNPAPGAVVDVSTFGARGDGKTDDTAAVAAAIQCVRAQLHRPVLRFPAGAFVLKSQLQADTFVVEGAGPSNTQLLFGDTKQAGSQGSAAAGYAMVVGVSWQELHSEKPCFVGVKNLSVVAGTATTVQHGLLFHSVFQADGTCENVQVSGFNNSGAVGVGLCNVQDVPFINLKVVDCWVGLQLSPAAKTDTADKGNHNTNLTFLNYVGQSNLSWSVGCLAGTGGCDNITFIGGVSQSAAGTLVNVASCASLSFTGHYFETSNTHHQELILADVVCAIQGCHFTSIGAMVSASGASTQLSVCACSFPSKFAQEPKRLLPNGARVVLSGKKILLFGPLFAIHKMIVLARQARDKHREKNTSKEDGFLACAGGASAAITACSPQLSVAKGCVATLIGFDHSYNTVGGAGKIVDVSNPAKTAGGELGAAAQRRSSVRHDVALLTLALLTLAVVVLAALLHEMWSAVHDLQRAPEAAIHRSLSL